MIKPRRMRGKSKSRRYRNYKVHIQPSIHPTVYDFIIPYVWLLVHVCVCVEALFSLDLQLCSVIEEKLKICRGTGRWSLASCRLLVQPHPENTPQGVTLLSDAQEEGNQSVFLSVDTQSGSTDLHQSLFLSQWWTWPSLCWLGFFLAYGHQVTMTTLARKEQTVSNHITNTHSVVQHKTITLLLKLL